MEKQGLKVSATHMSETGIVGSMCVFMPVLWYQLPARGPQHYRGVCPQSWGGF